MISIGGENLIDLVSGDVEADGLPRYVAIRVARPTMWPSPPRARVSLSPI